MTIDRRSACDAAGEGNVDLEPVGLVDDESASGGGCCSSAEECVAFRAGLRPLVVMEPRADLRCCGQCGRVRALLDDLVINEIRVRHGVPTLRVRDARTKEACHRVDRNSTPSYHFSTQQPEVASCHRRLHTCGRPVIGGVG